MPQHLSGEEARTWILSPENAPRPTPTTPVNPIKTGQAGGSTGPAYVPPVAAYQQLQPPAVYQEPPGSARIRLGDWLAGGWQVYKENWALMSVATLFGAFLSVCTLGILTGPLLMGMLSMAFKTMNGEQPRMGDVFNWRGRFLQSFLTFLIFFVPHVVLAGLGNASSFFNLIYLALTPTFAIMLSLTLSHVFERGDDVIDSINDIGRLVFSHNWFSWWLVGLVVAAITAGGGFLCGVGALVTFPWMLCAVAVAYRDIFPFDDPNRTNQ
jgi:hypothetical protein